MVKISDASTMGLLGTIVVLTVLTSCGTQNNGNVSSSDNRKEILGRDFSNSEVRSIDIVEIEHPMLGGIIETTRISENEKEKFLTDFDNLKQKGIYKCAAKYVIRLNMENDTLRLKVCGTIVANRKNDMYYESDSEKSLIEDYLNSK
ncbi:MAG: hypothetical protein COA58_09155 [Bacteroidetes bacterium]|nr:MAG: hypothetical protein COA58_09155 [Bacteroidota bacterium]